MPLPERNPEANMPGYDFARFSDSGEQTSSVAASPGSIPKTGRDIVGTVAGGAVMGLATFISGRFFCNQLAHDLFQHSTPELERWFDSVTAWGH